MSPPCPSAKDPDHGAASSASPPDGYGSTATTKLAVQRAYSDNPAIANLRVRDPAWREVMARREPDVKAVAGRTADLSALSDAELRQLELLAAKVR